MGLPDVLAPHGREIDMVEFFPQIICKDLCPMAFPAADGPANNATIPGLPRASRENPGLLRPEFTWATPLSPTRARHPHSTLGRRQGNRRLMW